MGDLESVSYLNIFAVIGYDGTTINGLKCHPDGVHIVYPMGNKVCVLNWDTKQMNFLTGHSNIVSAVAISPGGNFIGSGQINHIGFKAPVILWDFKKKTLLAKHELHKVRVEALVFSCNESLMISVGGRDCGQIVVWDTKINAASCTVTAAKVTSGDAVTVAPLNKRVSSFVSGGDGTLRLWTFNPQKKKISVLDITLGKLKRYIICITITTNDTLAFCGTTSGDIIKISLGFDANSDSDDPSHPPGIISCMAKCGGWKKGATRPELVSYSSGARCIVVMENHNLIVGAGDGTVDLVEEIIWKAPFPKARLVSPATPDLKVLKTYKFNSAITSLQLKDLPVLKGCEQHIFVGTKKCEIYAINIKTFDVKLMITSHNSAINTVAFPKGMSEVFATAGCGDIRVWALQSRLELLRIQVPNFMCSSVLFSGDGKSIVSGWNDGCIRAFTPLTGRVMYCILNCHNKGTSAIAMTDDGKTLISGGCEGQVRVWSIEPEKQNLKAVLKEHKCPVSAIKINNTNTEAVSAGTDGSCIIWDILNTCRRQILFANTVFMCACYHPSGCQILTGGSDRRVAYWEAGTGNLAREVEASRRDAVNALHINHTGELFVTGGNDQKVKLWKYQEGIYTHVGLGHSGVVSAISFSPDGKYIVSTSVSGSVIIWNCPEEYQQCTSAKSDRSQTLKRVMEKSPHSHKSRKEENISTMNTGRESIITSCPEKCANDEKLEARNKKGDGLEIGKSECPSGKSMSHRSNASTQSSKTGN